MSLKYVSKTSICNAVLFAMRWWLSVYILIKHVSIVTGAWLCCPFEVGCVGDVTHQNWGRINRDNFFVFLNLILSHVLFLFTQILHHCSSFCFSWIISVYTGAVKEKSEPLLLLCLRNLCFCFGHLEWSLILCFFVHICKEAIQWYTHWEIISELKQEGSKRNRQRDTVLVCKPHSTSVL